MRGPYDAHFEYRFMEALRNYVQHRVFRFTLQRISQWWKDGP